MLQNKELFKISYTKLSTFRRCLQKYRWKYVEHYYPRSSIGQARGSAGHAALAEWHKNYDEQKSLDTAWQKWSDDGFEQNEEWQLLENALTRYFPWSKTHDKFRIIRSEYKFEIEYELMHQQKLFPILFEGYIDGVVKENDQIWLLENKFNKRISTKNLELDAQVTLYLLAMFNMQKSVEGVIYNIVRVGNTKIAKKEPAVRVRLHRNKEGLARVQKEILLQTIAMINFENGGEFYRNPTRNCSWDCPFYQACLSMQDDSLEPKHLLEQACYIRKDS